MSTRPRIGFDSEGKCNACQWTETKKTLDWDSRIEELHTLLGSVERKQGKFDCIVPVSGGKDGSYVAYNLKHKYGMNPLAVTVTPALPLELGEQNLRAFVESGYDHITVNANAKAMQQLNRLGLIEMGFPYYGWLIAIHTAVLRMAVAFDIDLIFYGEDGEVEYGGAAGTKVKPVYGTDYMRKIYLESGYDKVITKSGLSENELFFFRFPEELENGKRDLKVTHWSYYENWDPYRNYLIAKEHCGLKESENTNAGTFTNYSQNDQALYSLHTYLMYLKFGFGRANQDASIEIRRGALQRDQAVNLVRLYDGLYPHDHLELYLDYYQLSKQEFDDALDRWANTDLFDKVDGYWKPKFEIN